MNLFENTPPGFSQQKKYIKDLKVGEKIDNYYKILGVSKRTKRDGGAFLTLELMDKTGKIPGKVWNNADNYFKTIQEGEIYKITGLVNEYMSRKELKVDALRPTAAGDANIDREDFIETASFDTAKAFRDMMETVRSNLNSPCLLRLIELFENEYGKTFKNHYGAQKIHHAYVGGLLEHTRAIIDLAIPIARHYSLDCELLITGALFHDLGKLFEFEVPPSKGATLAGGLLGHITIGCQKFLELKNQVPDFPDELSCKIQHLIVSHHGEKEFGSPEVPKIPEAFVLNHLDALDSRLKILEEVVNSTEGGKLFSEYVNVLERRVYVPPKGG
jgi:3'-5' exoribonuclease